MFATGLTYGELVIIEIEVIEQIEDEPHGRTLSWVCDLISSLGRDDPLTVVDSMWRGGYVKLCASPDDNLLPEWKWNEIVRSRTPTDDIFVMATEAGTKWAH